jgi:hypothetical protein
VPSQAAYSACLAAGGRCRRDVEQHQIAFADCCPTQRHCQVCLVDAVRCKAAGRQLTDLPRVDRRLRCKVNAIQFARRREVRDLAGRLDPSLIALRDLALTQQGGSLPARCWPSP